MSLCLYISKTCHSSSENGNTRNPNTGNTKRCASYFPFTLNYLPSATVLSSLTNISIRSSARSSEIMSSRPNTPTSRLLPLTASSISTECCGGRKVVSHFGFKKGKQGKRVFRGGSREISQIKKNVPGKRRLSCLCPSFARVAAPILQLSGLSLCFLARTDPH